MVQTGSIQQMREALSRQGVQVAGLSDEQVMKLCSDKLRESLTGRNVGSNVDGFIKNLKYNVKYPLPNGTDVQVARVGMSELPSGRKIETFVDRAGQQYFQYRSHDDTVLDEKYFKSQEKNLKLGIGEKLQFMNGKLYKIGMLGDITLVEKETPRFKPINQQLQEQKFKRNLQLSVLNDKLCEKFNNPEDKAIIKKFMSVIENGNYAAIPSIIDSSFRKSYYSGYRTEPLDDKKDLLGNVVYADNSKIFDSGDRLKRWLLSLDESKIPQLLEHLADSSEAEFIDQAFMLEYENFQKIYQELLRLREYNPEESSVEQDLKELESYKFFPKNFK